MIARLAPGFLVRWFARPYVAGGTMDDGLDVAHDRQVRFGALATLDLLGEGETDPAQVEANVSTYRTLIDRLATDPRFADRATRPTVSLKPSAFAVRGMDEAEVHLRGIVEHASAQGVGVTIDMEDHPWTDRTLDWSIRLFEAGHDVGTVLQTRLNRTAADLERIPAGMRLRLVIGIYPEDAAIAVTSKPVMKERLLDYARVLLERGARVEFATHDEPTLERFLREVAPGHEDACEIQMLLGVPRRPFAKRLLDGEFGVQVPFRLYVPFATSWDDATAYLRRRMRESPSVMWLVLRNLHKARKA